MGNRQLQEAAYQKAAGIADILLRDGVPLLAFAQFDMGAALGFVFQLDGAPAQYAMRLPTDDATPERVREIYETVR